MIEYDYMKYIEAVGKKEARQFKRAMANPLTKFETTMMPQLIDEVGYYPLFWQRRKAAKHWAWPNSQK